MGTKDDVILLTRTLLEFSKTAVTEYTPRYLQCHFEIDEQTRDRLICQKRLNEWKDIGKEVSKTEELTQLLLPCALDYVNDFLYDFRTYIYLLRCTISAQKFMSDIQMSILRGNPTSDYTLSHCSDKALAARMAFIKYHTYFEEKTKQFFEEFGQRLY